MAASLVVAAPLGSPVAKAGTTNSECSLPVALTNKGKRILCRLN